ncbi:MAG: hypothetical protein ABI091_21960 [Ferruginibacter sp.]
MKRHFSQGTLIGLSFIISAIQEDEKSSNGSAFFNKAEALFPTVSLKK